MSHFGLHCEDPMAQFELYTTLGCHLCEQAEEMLRAQEQDVSLDWAAVEIADSDALVEAYGIRIPVVRCTGSGEELGWPFTGEALRDWIKAQAR